MINTVIPSYYTHLYILTFILRSHTHIEHAPEIDGSEHAKDESMALHIVDEER